MTQRRRPLTGETAAAAVAPRLGSAALVTRDGKLLLVRRDKEPHRGKWVVPGGRVRRFEPLQQAASREVLEETGLRVSANRIAGVKEIIEPPHEHRVVVYWEAAWTGGDLRPGSDASAAVFASPAEIEALAAAGQLTPTTVEAVRDFWLRARTAPTGRPACAEAEAHASRPGARAQAGEHGPAA
jgi:acetyl-CoA carboxylase carboxyl transferase subunit beta